MQSQEGVTPALLLVFERSNFVMTGFFTLSLFYILIVLYVYVHNIMIS